MPPPTDTTEERARAAWIGFESDMTGESSRLSRVTGTMTYKAGSTAASRYVDADDVLNVSWTWGSNPAISFEIDPIDGPWEFSARCFSDYKYLKYLSTTYQTRTFDEDRTCNSIFDVDDLGEESLQFTFVTSATGADLVSIEENPDYSVQAYFETPDGAYTILADRNARLVRLSFDDTEASGELAAEYFTRRALERPSYATKSSAKVVEDTYSDGFEMHWEALEVPQQVRVSDLEVRVNHLSDDYTWTTQWTFPLSGPPQQNRGEWTFVSELSGGEHVVPGDRFVISSPDLSDDASYRVVVWDKWANEEINANPIPAMEVPALLIGLAVALFVVRRSRA